MQVRTAIIGGTGIADRLTQLPGKVIHVPTTEGQMAGRLTSSVVLVSRHSSGHKVPPHKVNYRAIALGLKKLGVEYCISTAAVGSMRKDWPVGTMLAVSDFVDLSGRNATLYDRSVVHTDFSSSISAKVRQALIESGEGVQQKGVYVCTNGPRYETPYEISLYAKIGDVVGMTAATEATVLHEAGIQYGCLAIVTNAAAGESDEVLTHADVSARMKASAATALETLLKAVERLNS